MNKLIFTPNEYALRLVSKSSQKDVAEISQKIFDKWLSQQQVVYGSNKRPLDGWNAKTYESTTHKAYLVYIEEIKKECPEHEPFAVIWRDRLEEFKCKHCGVELTAKWEEKR